MGAVAATPAVIDQLGETAELMLADLDRVCAEMDAAVIEVAPVLASDPVLEAELSASERANLRRFLTGLARRDGRPPPVDVPPEALDIARTIVRRGIELEVIFYGYRRAHRVAWRHWLGFAARAVPPGPGLVELLEISSQLMFDYVDELLARVLAGVQREREEVLGGALARRTETIRLILDGAPIDRQQASERLGYELGRRHTALVLWAEPPGDVHGALEATATVLARAAGANRPLTLPAGTSALWAWIGTDSDPTLGRLRDAAGAIAPNVRVAVGPPRRGVTGFRRSHAAALAIQRLLAGHPGGTPIAIYHELEVTALAAQDQERLNEFVAATLGELAVDTPTAARLRETLRVFLDEAENAPRAGARLHTHRNTILQRVARATEMLGHDPAERRLAVMLALELVHQLGDRVLVKA
jgi:DNA-binding PucR family transcriptional regulator